MAAESLEVAVWEEWWRWRTRVLCGKRWPLPPDLSCNSRAYLSAIILPHTLQTYRFVVVVVVGGPHTRTRTPVYARACVSNEFLHSRVYDFRVVFLDGLIFFFLVTCPTRQKDSCSSAGTSRADNYDSSDWFFLFRVRSAIIINVVWNFVVE